MKEGKEEGRKERKKNEGKKEGKDSISSEKMQKRYSVGKRR